MDKTPLLSNEQILRPGRTMKPTVVRNIYEAHRLKQEARIAELEGALRLIGVEHCASFTTGPGSCFKYGRTPDAKYAAERCCDQCIAHAALTSKATHDSTP